MLYLTYPENNVTAVKNAISHLKEYNNMLCFYSPLAMRTDVPTVVHVARCLISK